MTDFALASEDAQFADEAHHVFKVTFAPYAREADRCGLFPDAMKAEPEMGRLMRAYVPLEYGGGWPSLADPSRIFSLATRPLLRVLAAEAAGYHDAPLFTALPGPNLAWPVVIALGSEEQRRAFFRAFTDDRALTWAAFALTEPGAGSDMSAIATTAAEVDGGYVLCGRKAFIGNGTRASWCVLFAMRKAGDGRFGMRAFLLGPADLAGVERWTLDVSGFRVLGVSALQFSHHFVPDRTRLRGRRGVMGFDGALAAFRYFRPTVAALAVGLAAAVVDEIAATASQQGARHVGARRWRRLFDWIGLTRGRIRAASLLVRKAAYLEECGVDSHAATSMAKAQAAALAMETAMQAATLAGAIASRAGSVLAKHVRDAKAFDVLEGTGDIHRLIAARALVGEVKKDGGARMASRADSVRDSLGCVTHREATATGRRRHEHSTDPR